MVETHLLCVAQPFPRALARDRVARPSRTHARTPARGHRTPKARPHARTHARTRARRALAVRKAG
eukprot:1777704-Pleurochrysis_carterae.AAC.6